METLTKRIPRGKGWHNTGAAVASTSWDTSCEGQVRRFNDETPGSGSLPARPRSNRQTVCVLVRNVSGFTILPKRMVAWASGYKGTRVAGYTRLDREEAAGIVDEFFAPAGVPDGEMFWLVVKGPVLAKMPLSNLASDVAVGDWLYCITAATTGATTAGRITRHVGTWTAAETTDGTAVKDAAFRRLIGQALSAKLTSDTNADILVDSDFNFKT